MFKDFFANMFDFSGTVSRREFWRTLLITLPVYFIVARFAEYFLLLVLLLLAISILYLLTQLLLRMLNPYREILILNWYSRRLILQQHQKRLGNGLLTARITAIQLLKIKLQESEPQSKNRQNPKKVVVIF